ncbi:MAG: hypothetical protein M1828_007124 [Chrysothrix sp. TS-e1954]|nr:MAG: hypothetical protein M1828_007124 [Chrysothrix sp. TS-e1954]
MTDSPAVRIPLDPQEQPLLDELLLIRDKLMLLKQDKTQYVKSSDVLSYYEQVLQQIEKLNVIRTNKRDEQNRLDAVLDDCLQLISLFFLTIGRNLEAPAMYSMTTTIKRLLDHLKEAGFFASKDLDSLENQLQKIEDSIERGKSCHNPHILTLLEARIESCRVTLVELQSVLAQLSPELAPVHEKLVSILRSLSGLNTKSKFPTSEVRDFQKQLQELKVCLEEKKNIHVASSRSLSLDERVVAYAEKIRHMSYDANALLPGEEVVQDLLERCLLWSDIVMERQGRIADRFKDVFDQLLSIRNQLDKLSLTQAWSLRETDLWGFQRKLDRIDESRCNGNFLCSGGGPAELYEQRTCLYLLRRSYATIYFMLIASEPVSEALLPIYNQLTTLRRCLVEVQKSGGVSSPRELYPYSMKLTSIDNMRKDGKFVVNGDIPEGQGSVVGLLSECFEMAYELRNEAERQEHSEKGSDASSAESDVDSGVQMKEASGGGGGGVPVKEMARLDMDGNNFLDGGGDGSGTALKRVVQP